MANKKIYQALPNGNKVSSIEVNTESPNKYHVRHYIGKVGNNSRYSALHTLIPFTTIVDDKVIPGVQPDQLIKVVKDWLEKQPELNQAKIDALNVFLDA